MRSIPRLIHLVGGMLFKIALMGQMTLTDLAVVQFEDGEPGTVVAIGNGDLHIVRITTRQKDNDTPLLEEVQVRTWKNGTASAGLVRRIAVDDRYLLGLYRCRLTTTVASMHRINELQPLPGTRLSIAVNERPPDDPSFEPRVRSPFAFEGDHLGHLEARLDPSTRGPASAPVYDPQGALVGITLEGWVLNTARTTVDIIPIARVRELILGDQSGAKAAATCLEFDLRNALTGRNTCEERIFQEQMAENQRQDAARKAQAQATQYAMQGRDLRRLEYRMEQNSFAWAPFVGWGGGNEFRLRPTAGIDIFLLPDRFFQIHIKLQGALQHAERNYEDEQALQLGFDRIRAQSQFGEGLLGFCLGKGDFFFGAMAGYGVESPVQMNRSYGGADFKTTSLTRWYRPVSQFEFGLQIAHLRLAMGFRTAHGAVPLVYKAMELGLPYSYAWPAEDLKANGTMIVLEMAYRIRGWWGTDQKAEARKEFNAKGGIPRPR